MCGIVGYFSLTDSVKKQTIISALNDLNHRGPDQMALWLSNDAKIAIGQNRLSINDLSNLNLPFTNKTKSVYVVANAEIYNYRALRLKLEAKGHQFSTICDLEVLPYLYDEYGINFINMLRGEFAFIIWDNNQKTMFAVRDRFGIKPLYYATAGNSIYFSSEIPPLLKIKEIESKWDISAFVDFTYLSLPYDKSLFKNIKQIPPAHYYSIQNTFHYINNYWDIKYSNKSTLSFDETIEAIRMKLVESVNIRTKADVPIGCYLSGGIDSATLLGIATKYSEKPIDAFTIEFDTKFVDESQIAERTCQHLGARFNKILVTEADIVENFELVIAKTCSPVSNTAGIARFLLSKFVHEQGYKAVLSGEGADEVFLGYFGAIIEAVEDPKLSSGYSLSKDDINILLQQLPVNRAADLPESIYKINSILNHTPSWLKTMAYFNAQHRSVLNSEIIDQYKNYNPYLNLMNSLNTQQKLLNFDNVQISSYTWIKSFFPNTMLNFIGDRAEMANSIEARQPFLDHELFELMQNVPTIMKIKGGIEKYLLRETARPFITDEMYKRKKFMFQAPPLNFNNENLLYNFICETIISNIAKSNLYDKKKVLQLIDISKKTDILTKEQKFELSYTLTNIASVLILNSIYNLSNL